MRREVRIKITRQELYFYPPERHYALSMHRHATTLRRLQSGELLSSEWVREVVIRLGMTVHIEYLYFHPDICFNYPPCLRAKPGSRSSS